MVVSSSSSISSEIKMRQYPKAHQREIYVKNKTDCLGSEASNTLLGRAGLAIQRRLEGLPIF